MFKTKKIIFILISIFLLSSFFCLTAFAEQKTVVVDVDVSKVQIKYTSGSSVSSTSWITLSPFNLSSPNGGIFQGTKIPSDNTVSNALQWNINTYFTNLKFKKSTEYHLTGYYALPWEKLVTDDGYFNLYQLKLYLCDSNRNKRIEVNTSNSSDISSWIKKNVKDGSNNADFGFYYFDIKFVPSSDFVGFFNTFITYSLVDPPNSRGYFGFSDLTLSYEYDGSQAIIDNQNENTDKIIDNQNENADKIIDNQNENADKEIQAEKDLYEQEKQEAEQSGDDSVDGALSSMPNDSEGIIDSFGSFIGTMLHTNTDCSIDFPELKTPSIGGLPSYTLSEKHPVNFNEFEELIPKSIMLVVRALLTIALIIFCYKELYSTIQYVVSLKKGGSD